MKRDTADGKINWLLVIPGPMLKRWAALMTRGSVKYESERKPGELRNWQKASGEAELERFQESAIRHFMHWLYGTNETDEAGEPIIEDHAAGVFFNINGAEYVREKSVELTEQPKEALYTPDGIPEGWYVSRDDKGWSIRRAEPGDVIEVKAGHPLPKFCCGDPGDCGQYDCPVAHVSAIRRIRR